jgi:hypothetical protein
VCFRHEGKNWPGLLLTLKLVQREPSSKNTVTFLCRFIPASHRGGIMSASVSVTDSECDAACAASPPFRFRSKMEELPVALINPETETVEAAERRTSPTTCPVSGARYTASYQPSAFPNSRRMNHDSLAELRQLSMRCRGVIVSGSSLVARNTNIWPVFMTVFERTRAPVSNLQREMVINTPRSG